MAIMGFLVHTLTQDAARVEETIARLPGISTYGVHQDSYVAAVAEALHTELDELLQQVREVQGVLAVYMTSCDFQDEME